MNNLVKFLILGLLIVCPSYLKAQEVPFAYLKCDLENKNQKRELVIELDLVNMEYWAIQKKDRPLHHGDFWMGGDKLDLIGQNDQFYEFENLRLWTSSRQVIPAYSPHTLIYDEEKFYYWNTPIVSDPTLNRETLKLKEYVTEYDSPRNRAHKCTLINMEEYINFRNEAQLSFDKFYDAALKRFEEEKAEEEKAKEEQRERFKL